MRNDLNMNTGRIAAQASHAANAFIHQARKYPEQMQLIKGINDWEKSTSQGFGTVLVLSANYNELTDVISKVRSAGISASVIDDPTFGYVVNPEIARLISTNEDTAPRQILDKGQIRIFRLETTCGYVFGNKDQLKLYLGHLPLHP
jgi:peptidyl-tRNA hydrolase